MKDYENTLATSAAEAEQTVAYWKELAELAQLEIHAIRDRIWKAVEHLNPDQNSPTELLCALLVADVDRMDWLQANAFKFGTLQGSHYFGQPPTFRSIRDIIDGLRKETK